MKTTSSGFAPLLILVVIALVLGGGAYTYKSITTPDTASVESAAETKQNSTPPPPIGQEEPWIVEPGSFYLTTGTASKELINSNGITQYGWILTSTKKPGTLIDTPMIIDTSVDSVSFDLNFSPTSDRSVILYVEQDGFVSQVMPAYVYDPNTPRSILIPFTSRGYDNFGTALGFRFVGDTPSKVTITNVKLLRHSVPQE